MRRSDVGSTLHEKSIEKKRRSTISNLHCPLLETFCMRLYRRTIDDYISYDRLREEFSRLHGAVDPLARSPMISPTSPPTSECYPILQYLFTKLKSPLLFDLVSDLPSVMNWVGLVQLLEGRISRAEAETETIGEMMDKGI